MIWYFVPRLGKIAEKQADARSGMTGRIVDSYTNIADGEALRPCRPRGSLCAREHGRIPRAPCIRQMRLVTQFNIARLSQQLPRSCSSSPRSAISALAEQSRRRRRASPTAIGSRCASTAMSQWIMWEVSGLFENIGTVYDGMATLTRRRRRAPMRRTRRFCRPSRRDPLRRGRPSIMARTTVSSTISP